MPYKHEAYKMKIPLEYNANAKLTLKDRAEIYELYKSGRYSQRQLAAKFGVSRRLIQFYANPDKLARHKEASAERQADGRYYDKDKHREYMRKHRQYKQSLYLDGKTVDK